MKFGKTIEGDVYGVLDCGDPADSTKVFSVIKKYETFITTVLEDVEVSVQSFYKREQIPILVEKSKVCFLPDRKKILKNILEEI